MSEPNSYTMKVRKKLPIGVILGLLGGSVFFIEWLPIFANRNSPIVSGQVVSREKTESSWGVPSVAFSIQIEGSEEIVQAITGRYLIDVVPDSVRFRYSGDTNREVFLFEHEEHPFWLLLLCWSIAVLFIILILKYRKVPQQTNV